MDKILGLGNVRRRMTNLLAHLAIDAVLSVYPDIVDSVQETIEPSIVVLSWIDFLRKYVLGMIKKDKSN